MKKSVVVSSQNGNDGEVCEEEHIIDAGDTSEDDESPAAEEAVIDAEEKVENDGMDAHDDTVVCSIHHLVIQKMVLMGVAITSEEERETLKLFPAVCLQFNCDCSYIAHQYHTRSWILHYEFMIMQLLGRSFRNSLQMILS